MALKVIALAIITPVYYTCGYSTGSYSAGGYRAGSYSTCIIMHVCTYVCSHVQRTYINYAFKCMYVNVRRAMSVWCYPIKTSLSYACMSTCILMYVCLFVRTYEYFCMCVCIIVCMHMMCKYACICVFM